jgi:hypothetical protein
MCYNQIPLYVVQVAMMIVIMAATADLRIKSKKARER